MNGTWVGWMVVAALVGWVYYRRGRRLFVRQRFSVRRLLARLILIGLLSIVLFPILSLTSGVGPTTGLVVGIAVGIYAVYLTKF